MGGPKTGSETAGKIALVVGGSRGIGRATARRLAASGFDLWVTYRSRHEEAEETKRQIEALGRSCELFAFDITDHAATQAALRDRAEVTPPYAVVFNAGIVRDNLMVWMNPEEWQSVLRTDLDGFYNIINTVLFPMLRERRGRIVAVASVSGQVGRAGQANYSAAKAGLIGACKALAREVGKRQILVNVVSPGLIDTELLAQVPKEQLLPMIPMDRLGQPEEVAAVIDFLCREEAMYIHGQVIGVNGGLAM